ncbi:hypothetical protein HN51_020083 [Arachis hypogaea]
MHSVKEIVSSGLPKKKLEKLKVTKGGTKYGQMEEKSDRMAAMLGGYALAYFAVLCGAFAWGLIYLHLLQSDVHTY